MSCNESTTSNTAPDEVGNDQKKKTDLKKTYFLKFLKTLISTVSTFFVKYAFFIDVKADYDFHKQQNWDKLLETDSDLFTKVNQRFDQNCL